MLIEAIVRLRGGKNSGKYSIISDGEEVALIDAATLDHADDMAVGAELSDSRLLEIQYQADYRAARERALGIVARREICRAALIRKLSENCSEPEVCEAVADEMERLGFVDDERYADMLAEELYRVKGFAQRRVAYELSRKGVDRFLAERAAADNAPDPAEAIDELLHGRLSRDTDTEAGLKRCMNTLARYGYGTGEILSALRRLRDELED